MIRTRGLAIAPNHANICEQHRELFKSAAEYLPFSHLIFTYFLFLHKKTGAHKWLKEKK